MALPTLPFVYRDMPAQKYPANTFPMEYPQGYERTYYGGANALLAGANAFLRAREARKIRELEEQRNSLEQMKLAQEIQRMQIESEKMLSPGDPWERLLKLPGAAGEVSAEQYLLQPGLGEGEGEEENFLRPGVLNPLQKAMQERIKQRQQIQQAELQTKLLEPRLKEQELRLKQQEIDLKQKELRKNAEGGEYTKDEISLAQKSLASPDFYHGLTDKTKEKIAPLLIKSGFAEWSPIAPETRKMIIGYRNLENIAKDAVKLLDEGAKSGPVTALKTKYGRVTGVTNKKDRQLQAKIALLKSTLMKEFSGTAQTEAEAKRLEPFLPQGYEQEEPLKDTLNNLIEESVRSSESLRGIGGGGIYGTQPSQAQTATTKRRQARINSVTGEYELF